MMNILHSDLRRLDLNLLLVFDALLRRRSVSAAADELAMSPSALSHALARLRAALGDDLFVRIGHAMQPTAYAERLASAVSAALETLSQGLAEAGGFQPERSERAFVIAVTDYTAFAVMPRLLARLQLAAPSVRFKLVHSRGRESAEGLAAGRIDFALGYVEDIAEPAAGIESFDWLEDRYVAIASRGHPGIRDRLSLAQYLAARHVVVTPWDETRGGIDRALERQGLRRDVALQLPSVLAAPFIIAETEWIMTLPRLAARPEPGRGHRPPRRAVRHPVLHPQGVQPCAPWPQRRPRLAARAIARLRPCSRLSQPICAVLMSVMVFPMSEAPLGARTGWAAAELEMRLSCGFNHARPSRAIVRAVAPREADASRMERPAPLLHHRAASGGTAP